MSEAAKAEEAPEKGVVPVDPEKEKRLQAARDHIRRTLIPDPNDGWPFGDDLVCEVKIIDEEPPNGPERLQWADRDVTITRDRWQRITRAKWNRIKGVRESPKGPPIFETRRDTLTAKGASMTIKELEAQPAVIAKALKAIDPDTPSTPEPEAKTIEAAPKKSPGRPRSKLKGG